MHRTKEHHIAFEVGQHMPEMPAARPPTCKCAGRKQEGVSRQEGREHQPCLTEYDGPQDAQRPLAVRLNQAAHVVI